MGRSMFVMPGAVQEKGREGFARQLAVATAPPEAHGAGAH